MKVKFILVNSEIAAEGFWHGENLESELEYAGMTSQSGVAVKNFQQAVAELSKATQENDLIILATSEPVNKTANIMSKVLGLPMDDEHERLAVPKDAQVLGSNGFALSKDEQVIICLCGDRNQVSDCFARFAIPFIFKFFVKNGESRTIQLHDSEMEKAKEFKDNFNDLDSKVIMYDRFLRILCKKESFEESSNFVHLQAREFLKSLPPIKHEEEKPKKTTAEKKEPLEEKPKRQKNTPAKKRTGEKSKFSKLQKAVLLVCALVFTGSVGYLGYHYMQSYTNEKHYMQLEQIYEEKADKVAGYPKDYQNKFAGLYAVNEDIAGWLDISGTSISYPVVQHEDNEYYLNHDFYGNKIPHGTPFVDSAADLEDESDNILIFGHNMTDGQMFAPLLQYQDIEFYKQHPTITFDSVYRDRDYKIISVFITNNNPEHGEIFPYHEFVDARSSKDTEEYIKDVMKRSLIITGVDVSADDKLLTLSTCSYEFDDARFVVVARKVRTGESRNVNTKDAKLNPSPLMPDVWYELYGGTRPNGTEYIPEINQPYEEEKEEEALGDEIDVDETSEDEVSEGQATQQSQQTAQQSQQAAQQSQQAAQQSQQAAQQSQQAAQQAQQSAQLKQEIAQQIQQAAEQKQQLSQQKQQADNTTKASNNNGECEGCLFTSYHENCTGDPNYCPCTCGFCRMLEKDYTGGVRKQSESKSSSSDDKKEDDNFKALSVSETLKVKVGGATKTYDTYDLICQVVQNEMGATFHPEALKAQAVAAYSYIKYNNMQGTAPSVLVKTPVTDDVKQAVKAVLGEGVYYGGKLCNTTYFSCSAGVTNNAKDVWGGSIAYLTSVEAPEDKRTNKYYGATAKLSEKTMASYIESYLNIDPNDYGDPDEWIDDLETYDNDVYIKSVTVAGKKITGRQFREGLMKSKIYSHAFDVEYKKGEFLFTTYGYGHGVGMSQLGAEQIAKSGKSYKEILQHYYTGTTVK